MGQLNITVEGTPARIVIGPTFAHVSLLPVEAERLIVELRNAVNTAQRRNAPRWKINDLQ